MASESSPFTAIHNVCRGNDPVPERKKPRYFVKQTDDRFAVWYADRQVRGTFMSRFSAQHFADSANKMLNDPVSLSED